MVLQEQPLSPVFFVSETARERVADFQSLINRNVVPMLKFGCWESLGHVTKMRIS